MDWIANEFTAAAPPRPRDEEFDWSRGRTCCPVSSGNALGRRWLDRSDRGLDGEDPEELEEWSVLVSSSLSPLKVKNIDELKLDGFLIIYSSLVTFNSIMCSSSVCGIS